MPNVLVYHVRVGDKDEDSNIEITYRVEGFPGFVFATTFQTTVGTIPIFFYLN